VSRETTAPGFGLDVFSLDDRMRLFGYVTADNRMSYLWLLRAFDSARSSYHVLLHASDLSAALDVLRATHPDCPDPADLELPRLLDALVDWGVLDRSQDAARATSLAEYRNRHSIYQFTEAGYRAHRAVESVLSASMDDTNLSRLVFADLLGDLTALAAANAAGDGEEVYRKLNRLDRALADVTERAARFYHMLGDLSRTQEISPETFLRHKDALLTHLRDFHDELQRYTPRLRAAVHAVEDTGLERMVAAAAESDDRIFRGPAERLADWNRRWIGLRSWLAPPGEQERSEADRLADATTAAIGDVLALLRRVTESRRGGVSRESQLRHLAAWFAGTTDVPAAHALFDAVFGLSAPRHVGIQHDDPEAVPSRLSWWTAPAVELSRSLVETGRQPGQGNGRPARLDRAESSRHRLRQDQLEWERRLTAAAAELAAAEALAVRLDATQTVLLLRLLDLALAARPPGRPGVPVAVAAHGVRLTLVPAPGRFCTVAASGGDLHLEGYMLSITPAGPAAAVPRPGTGSNLVPA
jgi:uncharacterized protein (TIGR02677 family)